MIELRFGCRGPCVVKMTVLKTVRAVWPGQLEGSDDVATRVANPVKKATREHESTKPDLM